MGMQKKYHFQDHKILCLGLKGPVDKHVASYPIYREVHGWEKNLRKLQEHLKRKDMTRWYHPGWTKIVQDFDTVIISDGLRGRDIIDFIRSKNPQMRIIIYYLNTKMDRGVNHPCWYQGLGCEFYSFDRKNATDFGLPFKHFCYPYYREERKATMKGDDYDVFFVGEDKGRYPELMQLKVQLLQMGMKPRFLIKRGKHIRYYGKKRKNTIAEAVPYEQVLDEIGKSRAVLEIVQEGQHGITYRAMEALLWEKKLITNFPEIKDYDFYCPENVFILGEQAVEELPDFLSRPLKPVDEAIKEQYLPEGWVEEFFTTYAPK